MKTYHLHMEGIVQGVGFRPFVYRMAHLMNIKGWVNNASDGVHVRFQLADEADAKRFVEAIIQKAPERAVIVRYHWQEVESEEAFSSFQIIHSESSGEARLMLPPDIATCASCLEELYDPGNHRFLYPFITCTDCGPRYSIIRALPYDREATSMDKFVMCPDCRAEYENPLDRRYHAQTNSCIDCPITLEVWTPEKGRQPASPLPEKIVEAWKEGKIIAIKGIGGYLLTCDATNEQAVALLRKRKKRPSKPLALMYPGWELLAEDVEMEVGEKLELESAEAPIVLMTVQQHSLHKLALQQIAPGLSQIGAMLPYTPLYHYLLSLFGKPIVATSGNPSNSTIVYEDEKALQSLGAIADVILLNDRDIVLPQDDSVLRFSKLKRRRILLRRSRGMAPSYVDADLNLPERDLLAMGAMLKSTFSLLHRGNLFVSQYLGNTDTLEAQENYRLVLQHFDKLFQPECEFIVVDKHPAYFPTQFGEELSREKGIPLFSVQHHRAHFYAILAEHHLLKSEEKILGVIWDGTGLGDDGHIWGGEFFEYSCFDMKRIGHIPYFDFILGDKMPREPRISALVLAGGLEEGHTFLTEKFTKEEWRIYQKLLEEKEGLKTSSIGRLFDGVASLVLGWDVQTYEGEAAMLLEEAAYRCFRRQGVSTRISYLHGVGLPANFTRFVVESVLQDLRKNLSPELIAAKFHVTLADYVAQFAERQGYQKIAFSGGVFQNAWLVDLLELFMQDKDLYFHHRLSPNDENISFGQLMAFLCSEHLGENKNNNS